MYDFQNKEFDKKIKEYMQVPTSNKEIKQLEKWGAIC